MAFKRHNSYEDPYLYPHKTGDKVVNLKTEKTGVIRCDYWLRKKRAPVIHVKYDDGTEEIEHIIDIANAGERLWKE